MRDLEEIKKLVERAIKTQDYMDGTMSGGIGPCKNILRIDATELSGKVLITVFYDYPATCGLSDCRYHVTNFDEVRYQKFVYRDNTLTEFGKDTLFDVACFGDDKDVTGEIDSFYEKTGLNRVRYEGQIAA